MSRSPNIKISAGSGRGGNITVAGAVAGGVGNEYSGPPPKGGLQTDISKLNMEIEGPSGNADFKEVSLFGLVEGGIQNKQVYSSTEMTQTAITGMKDGKAEKVITAHTIHGGVGNTGQHYFAEKISNTHISGSRGITTVGDITSEKVSIQNFGPGTSNTLQSSDKCSKQKNIKDYTVKDVEALLTKEAFPDAIIEKFVENGINGKYFMNLQTDDVLEELGLKSSLLKMKIRTLIEDFS